MKGFKLIPVFIFLSLCFVFKNAEAAPFFINSTNAAIDQDSSKISVFPDSSRWILVKMVGVKSKKQHTGNKTFVIIKKAKQKIVGYTSCNSMKGKIIFQDSTVAISGIGKGDRECDDKTNEREQLFRDILQKSNSWKIIGDMLYFYENGKLILEFKAAAEK